MKQVYLFIISTHNVKRLVSWNKPVTVSSWLLFLIHVTFLLLPIKSQMLKLSTVRLHFMCSFTVFKKLIYKCFEYKTL